MSRKALVIEDDPDVAKLICIQLQHKGLDVTSASAGEEGLEAARRDRPDLILLDLRMHPISGFEVLRRLHADPRTLDIPVLVVSIIEAGDRAAAEGAQGFLQKPFKAKELARAIDSIFGDGD